MSKNITTRMIQADYQEMIRLSDLRKAENARRRAAALAHDGLRNVLLEEAQRRGQAQIDWTNYFRDADILQGASRGEISGWGGGS